MRGSTIPAAQWRHEDMIGEPPPLTRIETVPRGSPSPPTPTKSNQTKKIKTESESKQYKVTAEAAKSESDAYSTHKSQYLKAEAPSKLVLHRPHSKVLRNVTAPYHVPASPSWVATPTQAYIPCRPAWVQVQPQASLMWPRPAATLQTTQVITAYPKTTLATSKITAQPMTTGQVIYPAPVVAMPLAAMPQRHAYLYASSRHEERQTHSPDSGFEDESGSSYPIDFNDGFSATRAKQLQQQVANDPLTHTLPSGESIYTCQPCQMTFKWRRHLEQHFLVHRSQEKPALCHICGKCFTRADHLNRHCATHDVAELTCQLCGAEFQRASHLDKHWRTVHPHGQILPHHEANTATEENSSGSENSSDEEHSPLPTTSREQSRESFLAQLLCPPQNSVAVPSLPKDINRLYGLKRGVRGAPNLPRRFGCSVCGRRFARSAHLHRHQRIHTGEKPFRCFQCGRSYARGDYLRAHLTMQHNQTELDCEVCSKPFTTISALNEHQRSEHGRMRAWYLQPGARQLNESMKEPMEENNDFSDEEGKLDDLHKASAQDDCEPNEG